MEILTHTLEWDGWAHINDHEPLDRAIYTKRCLVRGFESINNAIVHKSYLVYTIYKIHVKDLILFITRLDIMSDGAAVEVLLWNNQGLAVNSEKEAEKRCQDHCDRNFSSTAPQNQ